MLSELFYRLDRFIRLALALSLLVLCGETLMVRSMLTSDGIVIGRPKMIVIHEYQAQKELKMSDAAREIARIATGRKR